MADCNKTVDFLRTLSRFCAGRRCSDCALCPNIDGEREKESCIAMVGDIGVAYAETIIPPLQRWADAHPVETWLERLQRALPGCNAPRVVVQMCPTEFFEGAPGYDCCPYEGKDGKVGDICYQCWSQEATDEL